MRKLPFPRLELRWRKSNKKKDGDMFPYYNWACDYILLLHPKCVGDIRCETGSVLIKKDVSYLLNTSYRHSTAEPYAGDTPYREHAHACWDAVALNIPVFSIYKRKAEPVVIEQQHRDIVRDRLRGTVAQ